MIKQFLSKYKNKYYRRYRMINVIGKDIEVVFSSNPYLINLKGRVIDETKNTIIIKTINGKKKIIPKSVCRFKIYNSKIYEVDGKLLIGTLDRRLKG